MNLRKIVSIFIFILFIADIYGQSTSSPYSIFAIGQVENIGFGTNHALGGSGIALRSKYSLNPVNPASYTTIDSLSFLFETGIYGKYTRYSSNDDTQTRYDANLRYLAMGCRVTRWWQTSFGFMPYSSVGYTINSIDLVEGELSAYSKVYEGSGGINQFYWAHSLRLFKNLGLGMNISYYLGSIIQSETGQSASGDIAYAITKTNQVNTVQLDYGAQYTFSVKDVDLTLGAIYSEQKKLSISSELIIDYDGGTVDLGEIEDIYYIPRKYGFGVAFEKADKIRASFDYERKEWEGLNTPKNNLLKTRDSERFAGGIEYTPYRGYRDAIFKKLSYRLGGNYTRSYLIIDGIPLDSYSLVMGVGVPLRKELTMINLSLEAGSYGTKSHGLFREDYLLLHINFTLHDKWFIKYSID